MEEIKRVHFVGVGGVGMGSLAVALSKAGWEVSGSDQALYEPMKSVLAEAGISVLQGFDSKNCTAVKPEIVVIGNVVRKDNPEASGWIQAGVPFVSFPQAVRRFLIRDKKAIICAGTHGKTTTTTWVATLLAQLGLEPSFLIGGVPDDLPAGSYCSEGEYFVGEGDEYDSAFFDKGPKFLHYNPHTLILTSVEFDHADIYKDLSDVKAAFRKLIAILPGDGLCVAHFDDENVMELVSDALCPVQTYGFGAGAMWRIGQVSESERGYEFEVVYKGRSLGNFNTTLFGKHNLLNILGGVAATVNLGISIEKIRPIVSRFQGVKRRQKVLMQKPIRLVDDFAHHPTEVRATLEAVRSRFAKGKIWALFEPRSATARRNIHQSNYAQAFDSADQILITSPYRGGEVTEEERFSPETLVQALNDQGKKAQHFPTTKALLEAFLQEVQPNDIAIVMSNGEFGKIQEEIMRKLN